MKRLLCILALMAIVTPLALAQTQIDPEWVYRWYYDTEESDQGDAIAIDHLGNIYVTGHTDSSLSYDDFITIRLTPDGDTVWTRIYDSPSDGIDDPEFIEVDAAGNVYVTGDVGRSSLAWKMDPVVLKYLPDGTLDWSYQYNGPSSMDDRVEGFGLDDLGNIYVAGYTKISTTPDREDYLLIKLLPTGDTAWTRTMITGNQTFDRLYDVAFDASNNIYVTGGLTVGGNYDIATIKYNQAGDTLWMRIYGGVALTDDVPVGIGVDAAGNVYVGGSTYNTTKDVLAIKYDANGVFQWATSFDGDGAGLDNPKDATVDSDGNVYVVGETTQNSQRDFQVVKFLSTGAVDWDFQYDAGGLEDEIVFAHKDLIKADNQGNVFFGGTTYYIPVGATNTTAMIFKLDVDGEIVWYGTYGGPGNDYDHIRAVELDQNNNCYVTGYSSGVYGNWDLFLLKFTGGGGPLPGAISGTVTIAETTTPISGVHVVAEGSGIETDTDVDGIYTLPGLPEGSYNVIFSHDDYYDTTIIDVVVVVDETTTLDVGMHPLPGAISGTVTIAETTTPIPGVHVVAEGTAVEAYSDIDGLYTLSDLPEGSYNVIFSHDDYSDTTIPDVPVVSGETTTQDVGMYHVPVGYEYLPGDVNMSVGAWPPAALSGDVTYLVNFFRGIPTSVACKFDGPLGLFWASADVNGDCNVIGSDVTKLVNVFRGITTTSFCEDYTPAWLTPADLPTEAPVGWPNCE